MMYGPTWARCSSSRTTAIALASCRVGEGGSEGGSLAPDEDFSSEDRAIADRIVECIGAAYIVLLWRYIRRPTPRFSCDSEQQMRRRARWPGKSFTCDMRRLSRRLRGALGRDRRMWKISFRK